MLKITVSPLDNRNSSIPNRTPLSVEMTINSSTADSLAGSTDQWKQMFRRIQAERAAPVRGSRRGGSGDQSGPLHVAGGRQHGLWRVDPRLQVPGPAGAFLVERVLGLIGDAAERREVHRLEELMIVLAHEAFTAVEHVELHVLEGGRDLH